MRNFKSNGVVLSTLALCSVVTSCAKPQQSQKPNVIYILADDLGIGDLGCYGQGMISTPNIDRLASQGMIFSDHYAGCSVSAPSRCVLLTGQHTGHSSIRGNRELDGEGQLPMDVSSYTLGDLFKDAGYSTAAFGKWGLGYPGSEGDPNNQGFDEFFGYNCQRQAHRYYPDHLWHNQERVVLEGNDFKNTVVYAPDLIQERALEYIEEKSKDDKPFFAYLAFIQPHAELIVPEDEIIESYRGKFEETPYVSPREGSDYGSNNFDIKYYASQKEPRATFAAMVTRLDKYVGEVLDVVEKAGIAENTIIVFSSDNGPHLEGGADPVFFNSNADGRGFKRDLTDGGIKVPMIVRWSGTVAEGSKSYHVSAFYDILPTMAEVVGLPIPTPFDGVSFVDELIGRKQKKHDFLYWEYSAGSGGMAVRMGDWKAVRLGINKNPEAKVELYNIVDDPEELTDLADQNPKIVAKVIDIMTREHTPNNNFPFLYEKK